MPDKKEDGMGLKTILLLFFVLGIFRVAEAGKLLKAGDTAPDSP